MYFKRNNLIFEKELQNVTANVKAKIPDNVYIHFDTFVYHRLFFTAAAVCFVSKDVPHSKPFELKTKFGKSYKKLTQTRNTSKYIKNIFFIESHSKKEGCINMRDMSINEKLIKM